MAKACKSYKHEIDGKTIKDTGHEALLMESFPDGNYNKSEWRGFSVKAGNILPLIKSSKLRGRRIRYRCHMNMVETVLKRSCVGISKNIYIVGIKM